MFSIQLIFITFKCPPFYITKGCLHIKLKRMFQYIILLFFKCFPLHVNNKNEKELLLVFRIIYIFSTDEANPVKVEAHLEPPTHPPQNQRTKICQPWCIFYSYEMCQWHIIKNGIMIFYRWFPLSMLEFFLLFTSFNCNRAAMTKWLYWAHITSDS